MESTILQIVLVLFIVFQFGVNLYDRRASKERESDLVAALIAKHLGEYALANAELKSTTKDKIKKIKAENELAIANQKLINGARGIPVT